MEINRKLNTTEFLNKVCISAVRLISTKKLTQKKSRDYKTMYTCVHLLNK